MSDHPHNTHCACCRRWAESAKEVDRLRALVGKLPRYRDTGEPFVPGVDPCWFKSSKTQVLNAQDPDDFTLVGGDWCIVEPGLTMNWYHDQFFSTSEAAAAAKED